MMGSSSTIIRQSSRSTSEVGFIDVISVMPFDLVSLMFENEALGN